MNIKLALPFLSLLIISLLFSCSVAEKKEQKIDRFLLVNRHNVVVNAFDSLSPLTVGNGEFAFTADVTGLQSFPELYENGICLGTQSEWGWHSFPNGQGFRLDEACQYFEVENRLVPYAVQWNEKGRKQDAANYFRVNPHRLQLAVVGLELLHSDQSAVQPGEISGINQKLDLWEGRLESHFEIAGQKYFVETFCSPENDRIYSQIKSEAVPAVKICFPYPTGNHVDDATSFENGEKHQSEIIFQEPNSVIFKHVLDTTVYFTRVVWKGNATLFEKEPHTFFLQPDSATTEFTFSVEFKTSNSFQNLPDYPDERSKVLAFWKNFWETGGMVDFSGTEDQRAAELERRVILSQYLTRVQCAGNFPPQETGLTFNSWYGKFHMEMHWWHSAHWAYWNRPDLLEKSLGYYFQIKEKAAQKANLQGYAGVRWPKMTANEGLDSPSGVGEFLIWQQPHILYFVEQLYQQNQSRELLEKYLPLVTETANFMADFARWDEQNKRYILGPPLIPAQESLEKEKTYNPPFELAYWQWGLSVAQIWLNRMSLPENPEWQKVINGLSEFAQKNGLYLAAESAPDSYEHEEYYSDHPMVLGMFGILPATLPVDTVIMAATFDYIEKNWNWERTWGWDYPMAAMCATRLGKPEQAIDLLLKDVLKNTYLPNGHNYQGERLRIYLPGNGGLLTAVAMMCAGFEGNSRPNPGFPESWKVKWENLHPVF